MQRRGKRPGGLLLLSELTRGSETLRKQLRLADEEQVVRLERLRSADGQSIAYEVDYLPYPHALSIYTRARELAEGSLYQLMASEGLIPAIAEQSIQEADGGDDGPSSRMCWEAWRGCHATAHVSDPTWFTHRQPDTILLPWAFRDTAYAASNEMSCPWETRAGASPAVPCYVMLPIEGARTGYGRGLPLTGQLGLAPRSTLTHAILAWEI